jgi:general secretion pathway protein M
MNPGALTLWYAKLTPRDQRILRIGAAAVVIILLLWLVLPLHRNLTQAGEHLRQQQEDLEWMRGVGPTLAAAGPGQASIAPANESLVVTIDRTARESGLAKALTGSTPAGKGAMRVQFENADFNLLVGWLHRLTTQQGLLIDDASISGNGGAGLVNASVLLRPAK